MTVLLAYCCPPRPTTTPFATGKRGGGSSIILISLQAQGGRPRQAQAGCTSHTERKQAVRCAGWGGTTSAEVFGVPTCGSPCLQHTAIAMSLERGRPGRALRQEPKGTHRRNQVHTVHGNRHFGITDLPILVFWGLFWALVIPHEGTKLAQIG